MDAEATRIIRMLSAAWTAARRFCRDSRFGVSVKKIEPPSIPGAPKPKGPAPSVDYVSDFLATTAGLALVKAFTQIKDAKLRRCIVDLVEGIADQ